MTLSAAPQRSASSAHQSSAPSPSRVYQSSAPNPSRVYQSSPNPSRVHQSSAPNPSRVSPHRPTVAVPRRSPQVVPCCHLGGERRTLDCAAVRRVDAVRGGRPPVGHRRKPGAQQPAGTEHCQQRVGRSVTSILDSANLPLILSHCPLIMDPCGIRMKGSRKKDAPLTGFGNGESMYVSTFIYARKVKKKKIQTLNRDDI